MPELLEKLIQPFLVKIKLKHPARASEGVPHSHTVAYLIEDADGFWLEVKCQHDGCKGKLRFKLLPEQAAQLRFCV